VSGDAGVIEAYLGGAEAAAQEATP
jgi:hypothetical protein